MTEIIYGEKYESTKGLSKVEIAKLIRADIKAAVKSGELPKAKYTVNTRLYAGGGSIDIRFSNVEPGILLYNPKRIIWDLENPHASHCDCPEDVLALYSNAATAIMKKLDAIHASYNFDGSDISSDYFHVRFYGEGKPDGDYARECRKAETAEHAATAEAPTPWYELPHNKPRPRLTLVPNPPAEPEPTNEYVEGLKLLGVL